MAAQSVERLERRAMPFEDYLRLPEDVRAEYVDGVALMTPPANFQHNRVAGRLYELLRESLPGLVIVFETGLRTSAARYRVPDLLVVEDEDDGMFTEQVPVIVVEVLSRSTRVEDTLRKPPEYLAAGIEQYWLVDRDARTITVLRATALDGGREWEIVLNLDADNPAGEVQVGDHGTVPLELGAIMPE